MAKSIQIALQQGETREPAESTSAVEVIDQHTGHPRPGPKKRGNVASAHRSDQRKPLQRSALFQAAVKQVGRLPVVQQDAIAEGILSELQANVDPERKLFQELVEAKYTRGLTLKEKRQMQDLEAKLLVSDEAFYRPILDRLRTRLVKKPRAS